MNFQAALRSDRMCKALTGLTIKEFTNLTADFSWNYREFEVKRKPNRKRKLGGGRDSYIETTGEKLFYILWYLKTYPTFDVASFYVGFAWSKACEWTHILLPVLEQTMQRKLSLPQRRISSVEEFIRLYPEVREVFADGIERSIQRSKNKKRQRRNYSGKRKQHTRKSVIISGKDKKILVVTKQKAGRRHDKRLADKESIFENLPEEVVAYVDTAFIGEEKKHGNLMVPKKKPPGGELSLEEKEMNRLISSYRVVVEHAIGGVKRYRCIGEKLRNHRQAIEDRFLLLAAGLWNYHLAS